MLTAIRSSSFSGELYNKPMHIERIAAPQPPPWELNGTTNPPGRPGRSFAQLVIVVFPGARPAISCYEISIFQRKIKLMITIKLMLRCAIKDNRHNLGVNEGQGMYWQGADNTHRGYGPPDEGPWQLAVGGGASCLYCKAGIVAGIMSWGQVNPVQQSNNMPPP